MFVDLVFVVDAGVVGLENRQSVQNFLTAVVTKLSIGTDAVRASRTVK